jgi:hypothetical protein
MSENAILDALDRMITAFKRQAQDESSPSHQLETRVMTQHFCGIGHCDHCDHRKTAFYGGRRGVGSRR